MTADSVATLASDLSAGYLSVLSGALVLDNSAASALLPPTLPGNLVPVGEVPRKTGNPVQFHAHYYLQLRVNNSGVRTHMDRAWAVGALITLADALDVEGYFDHNHDLELIYHLRNAVAHGNRFTFTRSGLHRMAKYPAYTILGAEPYPVLFEISPSLEGSSVLFDFIEPGDILALMTTASMHLRKYAYHHPAP